MNILLVLTVILSLMGISATAGGAEEFNAMRNVQHATLLTNAELSEVQGTVLLYGAIRVPVYFESLAAFMNEVLATLYGVDGRSPIATFTTVRPVVTPLPNGGITVRVESQTFFLVKTLVCVVCTRF